MADTRMQLVVEDWVRENWMRARFARDFQRKRVDLSTNGKGRFDFDAVAMDGPVVKIVASISTRARSSWRSLRTSGWTCSIASIASYWAAAARATVIRVSPVESETRCRWK